MPNTPCVNILCPVISNKWKRVSNPRKKKNEYEFPYDCFIYGETLSEAKIKISTAHFVQVVEATERIYVNAK